MESVVDLIYNLPKFIILFYPGYITIFIYHFLVETYYKDSKWIVAKCVCISYLYAIVAYQLPYVRENSFVLNVILILMSIIVGYISARIRNSKNFERILQWAEKYGTYSMDEFELLREDDRSAWICVYLKNSDIIYEGSLRDVGTRTTGGRYVCLSGYRKYILNNDKKPQDPYLEEHDEDDEEKVIIYYDNIDLIEKRNTKV